MDSFQPSRKTESSFMSVSDDGMKGPTILANEVLMIFTIYVLRSNECEISCFSTYYRIDIPIDMW